MIKWRDKNKIVFFSLIMMVVFCDTGTDHIFVSQKNRLGLAGRAGGKVEAAGIIVVNVNI
jgi:hypothetical protein